MQKVEHMLTKLEALEQFILCLRDDFVDENENLQQHPQTISVSDLVWLQCAAQELAELARTVSQGEMKMWLLTELITSAPPAMKRKSFDKKLSNIKTVVTAAYFL
mgnify:CR=1 FL=1